MVCFIEHSDLINLLPNAEMIPAQDVNEIIYGCFALIVVVNNIGSGALDVFSSSNAVRVPGFCSIHKLWPY